jgi:hypothetical protein
VRGDSLSANQILDLWDAGRRASAHDRPLLVLHAVSDLPLDTLRALPLGARDARLLQVRAATFGSRLVGLTSCPACEETAELECDVEALASRTASTATDVVDAGGMRVRVRPPNTGDVEAAAAAHSVADARRQLLERCAVIDAAAPVPVTALPEDVLEAIERRMADLDPLADAQLLLTCPACSTAWQAVFDISSFLWTEIEAAGARLLNDVHVLASAYGWREADILAMSPARRRAYLELARG